MSQFLKIQFYVKLNNMKKALIIISIVAIVVIAGSIFYYYLIYRPKLNQEEFTFQKERYESEQEEKQENKQALKRCLKEADDWYNGMLDRAKADNISMNTEAHELLWKMYQDKKDDCYKLYSE